MPIQRPRWCRWFSRTTPTRWGSCWAEPSCTLIDIAGAIAAFRHARELMVTAAVDGLEFLNPIKVGRLHRPQGARDRDLHDIARGGSEGLLGRGADGPPTDDQPRPSDIRHARTRGRSREDPAAGIGNGPGKAIAGSGESCDARQHLARRAQHSSEPRMCSSEPRIRSAGLQPCLVSICALGLRPRLQLDDALLQIDRHAVAAQELVPDDATEPEAQQDARRPQVQTRQPTDCGTRSCW